jgi:3-oxoadipate enol-lactonase
MKYDMNDGFLEYEQFGQGIPLLFIHGYPLSRKIWAPQLQGLSDIATTISLDLRGHGASYPFDGSYSMDLLAEDCYSFLREKNIQPPVVVCGLSMGGYVTFALYRKHPELFRAMILTSTRAAADSPEGKANREAGINNVKEHGVEMIAEGMLQKLVSPKTITSNPNLLEMIKSIMLETSVNGVIGALQGMRDRPDSTALLSQINCPVLIIHGADDQLIPVKDANAMNQAIKSSRLVVIPEAGHLLNMEQPEIFNQAIRDFVNTLGQD